MNESDGEADYLIEGKKDTGTTGSQPIVIGVTTEGAYAQPYQVPSAVPVPL